MAVELDDIISDIRRTINLGKQELTRIDSYLSVTEDESEAARLQQEKQRIFQKLIQLGTKIRELIAANQKYLNSDKRGQQSFQGVSGKKFGSTAAAAGVRAAENEINKRQLANQKLEGLLSEIAELCSESGTSSSGSAENPAAFQKKKTMGTASRTLASTSSADYGFGFPDMQGESFLGSSGAKKKR